jgi:hypothetical protein
MISARAGRRSEWQTFARSVTCVAVAVASVLAHIARADVVGRDFSQVDEERLRVELCKNKQAGDACGTDEKERPLVCIEALCLDGACLGCDSVSARHLDYLPPPPPNLDANTRVVRLRWASRAGVASALVGALALLGLQRVSRRPTRSMALALAGVITAAGVAIGIAGAVGESNARADAWWAAHSDASPRGRLDPSSEHERRQSRAEWLLELTRRSSLP